MRNLAVTSALTGVLVGGLFAFGCGGGGSGGAGGSGNASGGDGGSQSGGKGGSGGSGGSKGGAGGSQGGSGSGGDSGASGMGGSSGTGGASGTGGSSGAGGSTGSGGASGAGGSAPAGPYAFGAHPMKYPSGSARPTGDQGALDAAVASFYDKWKTKYLAKDCPGGYYLSSGGGAGAGAADNITTSEAHGYAMMITALMNGHDPDAQTNFDNLVAMIQKYPSRITKNLMAWGIKPMCAALAPDDADSASDGDLDMAYSLLLAEKIWGNGGKYNYGQMAKDMIAAVEAGDMNQDTSLAKLGDFVSVNDGDSYYYTRGSDFMVDHYRAFAKASGDNFWNGTVTAVYKLVDYMQSKFAPQTGLIPDFMMNTNTAMPVEIPLSITNDPVGLAEGLHTDYDYNSCRVPWRLATDYIVTGDAKVKARLAPINAFIQRQTGGDPSKIIDGYSLAGQPWTQVPGEMVNGMPVKPGENGCFTSSFGSGAIVDSGNQEWVDAVWKFMLSKNFDSEDEYTNSVNLLNMIVMTGNWWAP